MKQKVPYSRIETLTSYGEVYTNPHVVLKDELKDLTVNKLERITGSI